MLFESLGEGNLLFIYNSQNVFIVWFGRIKVGFMMKEVCCLCFEGYVDIDKEKDLRIFFYPEK